MFARVKRSGDRKYLQIVENHREGKRTVQKVIATLGRVDQMGKDNKVDVLMRSLSRFAVKLQLIEGHRLGNLRATSTTTIGPELVFGSLWKKLSLDQIVNQTLEERRFAFDVERAVFSSVLHRIFSSGSDRDCASWLRDVRVTGAEAIKLHHLYRAMRFLGEEKEKLEEALFFETKDLFTKTSLCFFDTTSLYFEGNGGETLGAYGHSKDHRPDLKQMVVGSVLTQDGRPLSCEMWPGNVSDAKLLLPIADRAKSRFGVGEISWVADRGMASDSVIEGLEQKGFTYILGARMRRIRKIAEGVLSCPGRFREAAENLKVKDVNLGGVRYIVCLNPEEKKKDAFDRENILLALQETLKCGPKAIVANKGYRRYLKIEKGSVRIDRSKVQEEERFDGKFVIRTNLKLPADEVALQYKNLIMVEQFFRAAKSLLETRPIYHKFDSTICGHVFVSFLALVLVYELKSRLKQKGHVLEWSQIIRDLEVLREVEVEDGGETYLLRTELKGVAGKVLQAAGAVIPPPVRVSPVVPRP